MPLSCDLHWFSSHAPLLKLTSGVIHFCSVYHDRGVWRTGEGSRALQATVMFSMHLLAPEGTVTLGLNSALFLWGALQPNTWCVKLSANKTIQ